MATTFQFKDSKTKGVATLYCRVQDTRHLLIDSQTGQTKPVNIRVTTGLKTDAEKWNLKRNGKKFKEYYEYEKGEGHEFYTQINRIRESVNLLLRENRSFELQEVKDIISSITTQKAREDEERRKKAEEEANRVTLAKYIDNYCEAFEKGSRTTHGGTQYAYNTSKSVRHNLGVLNEYVKANGIDFADIDNHFYQEFLAYLRKPKSEGGREYSNLTVGSVIKDLKIMMNNARREKMHDNMNYQDFVVIKTDISDSIFLTKDEIQKIMDVNLYDEKNILELHNNPKTAELMRDIFIIGCCTGQRVSDYNNFKPENIQSVTIEGKTIKTIRIRQQKTGISVMIPIQGVLQTTLEKYNYIPPTTKYAQDINDYIKRIGKLAGIDSPVVVRDTKGGKVHETTFKRYELITTHTARRSYASNEYLAGTDVLDIMRVTGHQSLKQLRTYIKADELDVLKKYIDEAKN